MKFMWFDGNSGSNCVFLLSYAFENIGKLVQYIVWCDYICIFNLYIWFDLPVRRLWPLGHTAGDLSLWPFGHTRQNNRIFHNVAERRYSRTTGRNSGRWRQCTENHDIASGTSDKTGIELMVVCGIRPHGYSFE